MKLSFFRRRSWKKHLAVAVTAGILAGAYAPGVMAADLAITGKYATDSKNFGTDVVTQIDDNSLVYDFKDIVKLHENSFTTAVYTSKVPSNMIINGDLSIIVHGSGISATGINAGYMNPDFNKDGNLRANMVINGNVTMKDDSYTGGWGITANDIHGGSFPDTNYEGARWQPVAIKAGLAGDITINGDVDIAVMGTGLATDPYYVAKNVDDYDLAHINLNGNVNIITPEDKTEAFYSVANYGGTININTDGTNVGDKKVVLFGNVLTMAERILSSGSSGGDYFYRDGRTNIALTNKDSVWTGVIDNTGKLLAGEVNLWLQNSATWNHESPSLVNGINLGGLPSPSNAHYGRYDGISHVNKLVGGNNAESSGYLYQKDSADINIADYSGYTTVFYEHLNSGVNASDYTAGDITIQKAAAGSGITLVTAYNNVKEDQINLVLNALAGKLTYADYSNNPDNLDATVKIAGGLTADAVTVKAGSIVFADSGKGGYESKETTFTTTLTGDAEADTEYKIAGVLQEDGSYRFTEDSKITVTASGAKAIDLQKSTNIDAANKTLTLSVTKDTDFATVKAINVTAPGEYQITADKIVIDANASDNTRVEGISASTYDVSSKINLTVNGDVDITTTNKNNYNLGIYAMGNTKVDVNGKLNINLNSTAANYYETSGIYAGGSLNWSNKDNNRGSEVNINGDVNVSGNGNGVLASYAGSVANLNGNTTIVATDAGKMSVAAQSGTVNVNIVEGSAGDKTVKLTGNVGLIGGAVNPSETVKETTINLGLTNDKSFLTGVIYDGFTDDNKAAGYTANANIWLQNGAIWNNELASAVVSDGWGTYPEFAGSHVTSFKGGASAAAAGNIYQKDSNAITIDNYSGVTNVFYANDAKGDFSSLGDTIIKHADADSAINLITTAPTSVNVDSITSVLSALAGKLTYVNYATANGSERNLTGTAKLAGGLTSDSVVMALGNIVFDEGTGKGTGVSDIEATGPDHQAVTEFANTLTGDVNNDLAYVLGGVRQADGSYKFTEDSKITVTASGAKAIDLQKSTNIDAANKTLTLSVTKDTDFATVKAINVTAPGEYQITADKIVIDANASDNTRVEGISASTYDVSSKINLTVNGDVDITTTNKNNYNLGIYAMGNTKVDVNGKLNINLNSTAANYYETSGIYAGGSLNWSNKDNNRGSEVNINGDVNVSGNGNGVLASYAGSVANLNGNTTIVATDAGKMSVAAQSGTVNVNIVEGSAGDKTVKLTGNVGLIGGAVNPSETVKETTINLGLTNDKSFLTGVIYDGFTDGNKAAGYTANANIWLQNGAIWNNELASAVVSDDWGTYPEFAGSHVTTFKGGASAAAAGNIYQNDSNALTIDNYSGVTNVFYDNKANGDFSAYGDIIIKHAEAGSAVNLITSSNGALTSDSISGILNAMAGKLTYAAYAENERNLTGTAKIAGGLTSDSVVMALGNIVFDESTGKGTGVSGIDIAGAPDHQVATTINSTLTGDADKDLEYTLAGVLQKDGTYKFTEDSKITVTASGAKAIDLQKSTNIDAANKTLTLSVTKATNYADVKAINITAPGEYQITADKIVIDANASDNTRVEGISASTKDISSKINLTVNSDVDITNTNKNYYNLGIYAMGNTKVDVNGNVNVNLNSTATNYYETSGIYAGGSLNINKDNNRGSEVNINGDVSISGNGNGVLASYAGSVANLNGNTTIVATDAGKMSVAAQSGTVNVNVNVVEGSAGDKTVKLTGNVGLIGGAVNPSETVKETTINLGLTNDKSFLTGVIYDGFTDDNRTAGYTANANIWLQNGAIWNNELASAVVSDDRGTYPEFTGSHVTTFKGGASAAAAGNIYQKDSNALTIDNYSGVTNVFYENKANGDFSAYGDTIIKHAEVGSIVNLITNGDGSVAADVNVITNTLSALAGKLTYVNYVDGERNLIGTVKLAGGLTADSVTWAVKDIAFDAKTGVGSINKDKPIEFPEAPEKQENTDFSSGLNGSSNLEYVYGGVQKDDGSYKFTENTQVTVQGENAVTDTNAINIDASGKTLTLNATNDSSSVMGVAQANGNAVNIKADKLVVNTEASNGYNSAKGIASLQKTLEQKAVTNVNATTEITAKGAYGAVGVYAGGNAELNLNGDTTIAITGNVSDASYGYYSTSGLYAASSYNIQTGATINAYGNVNVKGDGTGIFANGGGSTIIVNGGVNIEATSDYMPAIVAQSGTVNINAKADANNVVNIKGNIVAGAGSVNSNEPCKESVVNINMLNNASVLHGVVYNQFPEAGIDAGASTYGLRVLREAASANFTGAVNLNLANGAKWINEAQGALPQAYTAGGGIAFTGSRVAQLTGGTGSSVGYIYQKDGNNPLTIDNLSGNINITYDHTIDETTQDLVFKAGNTVIGSAEAGSRVTMATAANGINTADKAAVEAAFAGLAQKLIYNGATASSANLTADMTIGGGLTGNTAIWKGNIEFTGTNGGYQAGSAEQAINLLFDEDVVSKDTRAAIMSSMVGWRNAAADTYSYRHSARAPQGGGHGPVDSGTRLGANDEGVWARTWGGQNKYSGNNTSFKTSFWAGQVGYDKNLANGWNVGVAFDYMTSNESYNSGSGDSKTYTLGFYGSKEVAKNEFVDVTAKLGRFANDFETKDILGRTVKGDYKATGFSVSGQYSKRFGNEAAGYFEPSAQLTIGRLGSSDFDSTGTLAGHISQDAFTSIVGTLGLEAGQASEHGRYFARLSLNHEFAGSMDTHFSDAYSSKTREFDLDGTWCDLTMGGTYELGDNLTFYGDVTKTLSGDYKHDWMINAGLRFTF